MSSGKGKDNVKQKIARNWYQTLINESEKTYQNDKPNFINKNCKKLNKICNQNIYKMKQNNNLTTLSFSIKSFKKCFKCGYRTPDQYNQF